MHYHLDEAVSRGHPSGRRATDADDLTGAVATRPPARASSQERGLIALQRAAGNRAVGQLVRAGRRSAPSLAVQRCTCDGGPTGGAKQDDEVPSQGVVGAEEEFQGPRQGVVGDEDEFQAPGQPAVQRATEPLPVQRVATFTASPVHQVNNLADVVVNGTPAGVTWPTLNGRQFWSNAEARAAINRPALKVTAAAAGGAGGAGAAGGAGGPGAAGGAGAGGGFDAEVDNVPNNTASFDETVLSAGPWRLNTTKGTIGAMLPALAAACTGPAASRFRAFGKPSDAAMFAANRRHEDHHANDHKSAFNATVVPWDQKLTQAKASGSKFHGATAADAEAALWAAMGGTPDQIADAFMAACQTAVDNYHGTAAGGPIGAPTGPGSRSHCAISWANYTNPS
jgi:hypothetical protein